jgi:hypothetical protein
MIFQKEEVGYEFGPVDRGKQIGADACEFWIFGHVSLVAEWLIVIWSSYDW